MNLLEVNITVLGSIEGVDEHALWKRSCGLYSSRVRHRSKVEQQPGMAVHVHKESWMSIEELSLHDTRRVAVAPDILRLPLLVVRCPTLYTLTGLMEYEVINTASVCASLSFPRVMNIDHIFRTYA